MTPRTYFFIRMAATALSLLAGSLTVLGPEKSPLAGSPPMVFWFLAGLALVGLLLAPLLVAGIIRHQSVAGSSAGALHRPSHFVNPLSFRSPQLFFHFAAFFIMAHGVGAMLTSPLGGVHQAVEGALRLTGGTACLFGVHLGMRWCSVGPGEGSKGTPNPTMEGTK